MFLAKRSWRSIENTLNLKVWTLPLIPWFHIVFHRYASKCVHFTFSSTILPLSLSSSCRTHMMGSTETLSCPSIPCHKTSSFTPSRQSHDDDELGYCFLDLDWVTRVSRGNAILWTSPFQLQLFPLIMWNKTKERWMKQIAICEQTTHITMSNRLYLHY